ncbi:MAG: hypothetical protein WC621_02145 [Patescibacteria group bacterium]
MKLTVKLAAQGLLTVFRRWNYLALASLVALLFLFLAIWLPNLSFLGYILGSKVFSLGAKLTILAASFEFLQTNFTFVTRWLAIILAILTGVNIALLVFYFKQRLTVARSAGGTLLSLVLGLVGVSCTACGSIILSAIFGLGVTTSFLIVLPLRGLEFGILSFSLLWLSIIMVARRIPAADSCNINKSL